MKRAGVWANFVRLLPPACAGLVPLAIYSASLQRWPDAWDTAELQVVTYILGIAHPTGFPLYTLAGYLASHIPIGTIVARTSMLNALCTAATALLAYAVARMLGVRAWPAALGACAAALGSTIWVTAIRADVHAMVALWEMSAFAAALAWRRTRTPHMLLLCGLAIGLALATHPVALWTLPAILCVILRLTTDERHLAFRALALALLPLLLYAYFPLRSAYVVAHGLDPLEQLGLAGNPFWNYANPSTPSGFVMLVTGSEFNKHDAALSVFNPLVWPANLMRLATSVIAEYGWVIPLAALGGFGALVRRAPLLGAALIGLGLPAAFFGLGYGVESFRDRYFIVFFWTLGIAAGAGVDALALAARGRHRIATLIACAAFAAACVPLVAAHRMWFPNMTGSEHAAVAQVIAARTAPNAILIAPWLRASELAYDVYVAHSMGARLLAVGSTWQFGGPRIAAWTKHRPVYAIDLPRGYESPEFTFIELNYEPHIVRVIPRALAQ